MADLITPMAIRVAATLRLADHVTAGADTAQALATRSGTDPDSMARLLRHLVTEGLFTQGPSERYGLTDLGRQLCDSGPAGTRAWLDSAGSVGRGDLAIIGLVDAVRTGRPSYAALYDRPFWADLEADPALAASFDDLMGSQFDEDSPVVTEYDWSSVGHVADVGGGNGALLGALLTAHPKMRGTLVELAGPAAAAARMLAASDLAERAEVVSGSFFGPLPSADLYILSGVLHNWDDQHALTILRRCAEAADAKGRVLVVDGLLEAAGDEPDRTAMDLRMLTFVGGRERTVQEFARLGETAGLTLTDVNRVSSAYALIEFVPA